MNFSNTQWLKRKVVEMQEKAELLGNEHLTATAAENRVMEDLNEAIEDGDIDVVGLIEDIVTEEVKLAYDNAKRATAHLFKELKQNNA
jgi:hypothetical protein